MSKLSNDATASAKGTIYQLCIAVQKCFEMLSGQTVLIEKQGDVSVEGGEQIEAKHYSDDLTDGHKNFWNTLNNWMRKDFDESKYSSLVLFTTQNFSSKTRLKNWNECTGSQRIDILEAIRKEFEDEFIRQQGKEPSKVLSHQRHVMDANNREKLQRVTANFVIEAASPDLPALHQRIKDQHIKGVLDGKKDDFLKAVFGFITQPGTTKADWEISFEAFAKEVQRLTTLYCRETYHFPIKHFGSMALTHNQIDTHQRYRFVLEIQAIEHHAVIAEAVGDYVAAMQTLNDELAKYEVSPEQSNRYCQDVLDVFIKKHRVASRDCANIIKDSQNFFDLTTSDNPINLSGFFDTPIRFRNGVLHMHMDDPAKDLHWKLNLNTQNE